MGQASVAFSIHFTEVRIKARAFLQVDAFR